ncbi:MAG: glycosyltransferase [Methanosarcinales archaeon]|nr:glycosyltransferase [Methanosarcinales archaeon]
MKKHDDNIEYAYKLATEKLNCGKSVADFTTYESIILWWIPYIRFYYRIHSLLNKDLGIVYGHNKYIIAVYKKVEFFFDLLKMLSIMIIIKINNKFIKVRPKIPKIVVTAQDIEWREIIDYDTNCIKKTDAFFDSILKRLSDGNTCSLIGIYPILNTAPMTSLKIYVEKLKYWYVTHKPFDVYWNINVYKKTKFSKKYFKEAFGVLKQDNLFKDVCICDEQNYYEQINRELETYFELSFPHIVKYIEMAKNMIDVEQPNLILIENEYGDFQRAIIIASKIKKVPTLAIQHGIITPTHLGYIFNKKDKEDIKKIIPDFTCVYGQYHYDLLTKNSIYDPNQVVITGQPRYDVLHHVNRIYSKKEFFKKYRINPAHRIILWTTQSHALSYEENINYLKEVVVAIENMDNATLIIKQHPGEGQKYTKMIKDYLSRFGIDAIMMQKDSDTYELLFICDLMIIKDSTTAMEAIALNKPVIVLNFSGDLDVVDYVEQGVALGVYNEGILKSTIEKLLENDSDLKNNRKIYIEKYLYKIDGKATERVVNLIEEIIRKKRK